MFTAKRCFIIFSAFVLLLISVISFQLQRDSNKNQQSKGLIIQLNKAFSHEHFIDVLHRSLNLQTDDEKKVINVEYKYHNVYYGLYLSPHQKYALLPEFFQRDEFKDIVINVQYDQMMEARAYSWGIDRIDQTSLPLDGKYNPYYTGSNVDVYVADTGLDTLHSEFQGNSNRVVKNIYDGYTVVKTNPSTNNDGNGHGTHCAGTIGGATIGVSTDANIYGVKVLTDNGGGLTSVIVAALDYISTYSQSSSNPAVVSMSLGGDCANNDCSGDALVMSVESLVQNGITVVVAAGNSACNACYGSPNAARGAIVVGASDINDKMTYFSNYGQCIDVFAPGYDIISALTSKLSGNEESYSSLSGTSMACPHVAGVVAQVLQKFSTTGKLLPSNIGQAISCEAVKSQLTLDVLDTISRNYLLQIPRPDDVSTTCDLTAECSGLNNCSQKGVCLPVSPVSSFLDSYGDVSYSTCHCDGNIAYGSDCSSSSDVSCPVDATTNVVVNMNADLTLTAWGYSSFGIYNTSTGLLFGNTFDSLCSTDSGSRSYCLPKGFYSYEVSLGLYPDLIEWNFCNVTGGAPSVMDFYINDLGNCQRYCPDNSISTNVQLYNTNGLGFSRAYYGIYSVNYDYKLVYGGTMLSYSSYESHDICLPVGCYIVQFRLAGTNPNDLLLEICGDKFGYTETKYVCIDENLQCTVTFLNLPTASPTLAIPTSVATFAPTIGSSVAVSAIQTISGCSSDEYNIDAEAGQSTIKESIASCFISAGMSLFTSNINDFRVYPSPSNPLDLLEFNISYTLIVPLSMNIPSTTLSSQLTNCVHSGNFTSYLKKFVSFDGPENLAEATSSIISVRIIQSESSVVDGGPSSSSSNSKSRARLLPKPYGMIILIVLCLIIAGIGLFFAYQRYNNYIKIKDQKVALLSAEGNGDLTEHLVSSNDLLKV